jgi:hypothetical protein
VYADDRRSVSPWLIVGVAAVVVIAAIATAFALTSGSDQQTADSLPSIETTIPGQTAAPTVGGVTVAPAPNAAVTSLPTVAPATVPPFTAPPPIAPATVAPTVVPTVTPAVAPATVAPTNAAPIELRCVRQDIDFSALRNGPGLEFDLLDQIPPGTCDVPVFGRTVGGGIRWLNVEYAGINGWSAESNFQS